MITHEVFEPPINISPPANLASALNAEETVRKKASATLSWHMGHRSNTTTVSKRMAKTAVVVWCASALQRRRASLG